MNQPMATALSAYILWGLFPVFWKLLDSHSAGEILSHRIIWSLAVFVGIFYFKFQNFKIFLQIDRGSVIRIFLAGILLSVNWLTYIYAVNSGHVIEGSLAYFITPLLNVAMGIVVFKERINYFSFTAFVLAVIAVGRMVFLEHQWPVFAFVMAVTFSSYGMLKKLIKVSPILSVTLESFFVFPLALIGAFYFRLQSPTAFLAVDFIYFIIGGIITALPIFWFSLAVQKVSLNVMGFMQFISPTIQFLLAIYLYNEPFSEIRKYSFVMIWVAIGIFLIGQIPFRKPSTFET
jgi:chloramphenicol-sensitive protein RarD